jgi:uncharacterized protein
MTYLVTGATGFIGTQLVERLLQRGDAVYYLARQRSSRLPSQASFHPWDITKKPDLNALSRIDGVFHLAGEPISQRWTPEIKKRIYDTRVQGTRNLTAALGELRHKPAVLVAASAIGYYGDRGNDVLTEREPPGVDFLATVCKDWEREASQAREFGLRVAPIRIAPVLGRGGGMLKAMLPPFRLGLGAKLGRGEQWMSWVAREDLVRLLLFAADTAGIDQALNGASPNPVTNAQFTGALGQVLHRPALLSAPKFAVKMLLGEMADFAFASLRVIPQAAVQAGFRFEYPTIEAALATAV